MTHLKMVEGEPNEALVDPEHLFTGVSYVPPSLEDLNLKTERIKRNLAEAYVDLHQIHDRAEWRAGDYQSWDDYCKREFEFTGNWGYKLAAAYKVNKNLIEAGEEPVKERVARVITDLDAETQVEVIRRGHELEATAYTGKAALYHKAGEISSRLAEKARAEIVPDRPKPVDAALTPPLKPRKKLERAPVAVPLKIFKAHRDPNGTGIVCYAEHAGEHVYMHIQCSLWNTYFPEP